MDQMLRAADRDRDEVAEVAGVVTAAGRHAPHAGGRRRGRPLA